MFCEFVHSVYKHVNVQLPDDILAADLASMSAFSFPKVPIYMRWNSDEGYNFAIAILMNKTKIVFVCIKINYN